MTTLCPCGSNNDYLQCCGRYIEQHQFPDTPEQLMRSRYTAYTQANIDYIANTMRDPAAKDFNRDEAKQFAQTAKWLGLEVVTSHIDQQDEDKGFVEFIATYQLNNQLTKMHEVSEFQRINQRWFYTDGKVASLCDSKPQQKVGRNDPCPCGSGKKFKKCCNVT